MEPYLNIDAEALKQNKSYWTAKEIQQQPEMWQKTSDLVSAHSNEIRSFLSPILEKQNLRIILSGAGTSAFIGDTLAPWLRKQLQRPVEAIATTDIVAAPEQYLYQETPTLLISFARSGNSPESTATVDLVNQCVTESYHLVLTCNSQGELALMEQSSGKAFVLVLPEETNDQSFAMTSSISSMIVACLSIFTPDVEQLKIAQETASDILVNKLDDIKHLAEQKVSRLVVLGSGTLFGVAKEGALKCLELTSGKLVCLSDSTLGFRHGPKSVIDGETQIIHLQSNNPYTKQYDHDLEQELLNDNLAKGVQTLNSNLNAALSKLDDVWLALPYLVYCQMYSFFKAQSLKITADNPCPTGEVNRVVQGVTIYPLNK